MSNGPGDDAKKSSGRTYSGIHNALVSAKRQLDNVHTNVDSIRGQLANTYGGEDGQAFIGVIDRWMGDFNRITAACDKIAATVEGSSHVDFKAQSNNLNEIHGRAQQSVFGGASHQAHNVMMGG
ncbi:hypothetical protein [Streptomyces sp. NPDC056160]|uniref:hypothetical protein n=1 Tax=Streptomyces sp. NPDC056160 TaxID=3345731 RepID=UPI0035DA7BB8